MYNRCGVAVGRSTRLQTIRRQGMNRNGRRKFKNTVQDCDRKIRQALYIFTGEIEDMLCDENGKRDNIPESLQNTTQEENYTTAIEMFEDLIKNAEAVETGLDDLLDTADVSSNFSPERRQDTVSAGRKGVSFHAILPPVLLEKLRSESRINGLSMNEILCRALLNEFEENSKISQKSSKRA